MKTPGQIIYETIASRITGRKPAQAPYLYERAKSDEKSDYEAAAQAVLSSQWRSVDDPPDNDLDSILLFGGNDGPRVSTFRGRSKARTHWMPIPAFPAPTEEEKSRAEFEAFWSLPSRPCLLKEDARVFWEAGRKSKEVKP